MVCATRGEVGEISNPSLATPETLGQVREEELRAACRALGVEDLFILGYRDSGMDGTLDNRHPQALCQADLHEVTGRTVAIIRQLRPQVVLTFDPNGGYGHPDHIFVHRAAREAFAAAGDDSRYREQLARSLGVFSPQRLYYTGIPRSALKAFRQAIIDAGIESDLRGHGPRDPGSPRRGDHHCGGRRGLWGVQAPGRPLPPHTNTGRRPSRLGPRACQVRVSIHRALDKGRALCPDGADAPGA